MAEIGLFPLELVLLPTERVPLHIFEDRYKELIGECLARDGEFGLVFADQHGVARDRDARRGRRRARAVPGRPAQHRRRGEGAVPARRAHRAAGRSRPPRSSASATTRMRPRTTTSSGRSSSSPSSRSSPSSEVDDPEPDAGFLSFQLAARVDFGAEVKQQLLEQRSEARRMHVARRAARERRPHAGARAGGARSRIAERQGLDG